MLRSNHVVQKLVLAALPAVLMIGIFGAQAGPATAAGPAVSIAGFVYSVNPITIMAGDTVTWSNDDEAIHDVTDMGGSWTSGIMKTGDTFSHTFDDAGTYAYVCKLHPWMIGSVVVGQP